MCSCVWIVIVSLVARASLVASLFEDQAFKFDWRQRYLGVPKKLVPLPDKPMVAVVTHANVLAVIDSESGHFRWRQVLHSGEEGFVHNHDLIVLGNGNILSISVMSQGVIVFRKWQMEDGILLKEVLLPQLELSKKSILNFALKSKFYRVLFKSQDNQNNENEKSFLEVSVYDAEKLSFVEKIEMVTSFKDPDMQCVASSSALVCFSPSLKSFCSSPLPIDENSSFQDLDLVVDSKAKEPRLVVGGRDVVALGDGVSGDFFLMIHFKSGQYQHTEQLQLRSNDESPDENICRLILGGLQDNTYFLEQECDLSFPASERKLRVTQSSGDFSSRETLFKYSLNVVNRGRFLEGVVLSPSEFLFLAEDGSLVYLSEKTSNFKWVREEGLAHIIAAEMVGYSSQAIMVDAEDSFEASSESLYIYTGDREGGWMARMALRIKYHLSKLRNLFHLVRDLDRFNKGTSTDELFQTRKVVLAVTAYGKVYGLDSISGQILWDFYLESTPVENVGQPSSARLFVQRKATALGLDPVCTVMYRSSSCLVVTFNPLSGKILYQETVPADVLDHSFMMHLPDDDHIRPIIYKDGRRGDAVRVLPPDLIGAVRQMSGKLYFARVVKQGVVGMRLEASKDDDGLVYVPTWSLDCPEGCRVISLTGKPPDQSVHSQGRVMADRSVLFKYVNPNLALLLTEGQDSSGKTFLNVFLVDLVSGRIVFSTTHKRVTGPYHHVHSENWAVYTYYNEKSRRSELTSLELFEGKVQSNQTLFSSLNNLLQQPIVERQSYVLSSSVVRAMADTVTERAITSKHIIMASATGAIYDIPRHLVDPRRPSFETPPDMREPGLPPYAPELHFPSESVLNYNQSVLRVAGILAAPTGLESTSVIFVYGLDLYSTRVTPSKGFDLLKDDFDYYVISCVLVALLMASYVTKKLAQRKSLKQAWR